MLRYNRRKPRANERLALVVLTFFKALTAIVMIWSFAQQSGLSANGNTGVELYSLTYFLNFAHIAWVLLTLYFVSRVSAQELFGGIITISTILEWVYALYAVVYLVIQLFNFLQCDTTWCHNLAVVSGAPPSGTDPNTLPPNTVFLWFVIAVAAQLVWHVLSAILSGQIAEIVNLQSEMWESTVRERFGARGSGFKRL